MEMLLLPIFTAWLTGVFNSLSILPCRFFYVELQESRGMGYVFWNDQWAGRSSSNIRCLFSSHFYKLALYLSWTSYLSQLALSPAIIVPCLLAVYRLRVFFPSFLFLVYFFPFFPSSSLICFFPFSFPRLLSFFLTCFLFCSLIFFSFPFPFFPGLFPFLSSVFYTILYIAWA